MNGLGLMKACHCQAYEAVTGIKVVQVSTTVHGVTMCVEQVNGDDLTQASHYHAYQALTNCLPVCRLTVYRERAEDSRPIEKEGQCSSNFVGFGLKAYKLIS